MIWDYLKSVIKNDTIEFMCLPEDHDVIPHPIPSRNVLPEWYKNLPAKIDKKDKLNNSTIRRCAPVQDAMSIGWLMLLAADVEIITNDDASGIQTKSTFSKTIVESHSKPQLNPPSGPQHPSMPKPPMKWISHWFIKMPSGYAALFVPPLNRPDPRFTCFSGMVDANYMYGDGEALESINFPFFFNQPNYTGIIRAGTPLVQVIPIKLTNVVMNTKKIKSRALNPKEESLIIRTRARRASHESYYRDTIWKRK